MNILIAPDKFKGSLHAQEVCEIIEQALAEEKFSCKVTTLPMADGGEGTWKLLTRFCNGKSIPVTVLDPLSRPVEAQYGLSGDGATAFIEMAEASGLQLLRKEEMDPLITTTFGTGQLIRDAIDRQVKKIILGIGGSATNDGGTGLLSALGVRFYSVDGALQHPVGRDLSSIVSIDASALDPRLKEISFMALCDVDNPLYGSRGAAHVFAPQKGADSHTVKVLDEGLRHFASVIKRSLGLDINFPGAGAGGGLSGGILPFFNVDFKPGIAFIMEYVGLENAIKQCDIVITGEGRVDEQTLSGKVVKGVTAMGKKFGKPVYLIAGKNLLPEDQLKPIGITEVITLTGISVTDAEAMKNASSILRQRVKENLVPFLLKACHA